MAVGVGSLSKLTGFLGVLALLSSLLAPAAAVPAPAAGAPLSPAGTASEQHAAATAISGQVFIDTNRNTLADGGEAGVGAVTLFVDMDGDGVRGSADRTTSTSESGAYALPVAGGTGVVCVEPPSHLTPLAPRCRFARGEATDFPLVTIPGGCAAGALMAPIGAIALRDAPNRFYRPLDLIGASAAPPPAGSRLEYHGATLVTLVQRDEVVATRMLLSAAASQQADLVLRLRYQRSYQTVEHVRAAGGAVARMADPTAPLPVDFAAVDRDGELLISGLPRDAAGRYLDLTVETRITADRGYLTAGAGIAGRVVDGRLTPVGNTCGDGSDSVIATGLGGPRPGAQPVFEAVLIVTTAADDGPGSLRQALTRANATAGHDTIIFGIPGSAPVIALASPLPRLTGPATVDGTTQPGGVTLDGARAGPATAGLALGASGSLLGLTIRAFTGDGVVLDGDAASLERLTVIGNGGHGVAVRGSGVTIAQAAIVDNGGTGIAITGGASATVRDSRLAGNDGLGIDLGDDGPTPNDVGDGDSGPNGLQNAPVVVRATPDSGGLRLEGLLNSAAGRAFTLEFFAAATCDPSGYGEGDTLVGRTSLTTAANGVSRFSLVLPVSVPEGHLISATATDAAGNTSEFGRCAVVSPPNDTWAGAEVLALTPVGAGAFEGAASRYLDRPGQARWFKFAVQPNSRVIVRLSHLPANYDLALYKDIADAYQSLATPADLARL
ncbi:MAG: right-handed parallel beta-helix repeat-containing protein, partial [Chloroflexi bacterium]|nr:right-handed parallel beta-helix repeat-containing protein [Chloroflexota bacterium]